MNLRPWLQPPRRTLAVFLATALALAGGLTWLGWQVVALDRNLEQQRTRERLGHALDLVAVSLGSWLDDVDRDLARLASDQSGISLATSERDNAEGVVLVATKDGLYAQPEGRLAYYPEWTAGDTHTPGSSTREAEALRLLSEAAALRSARPDAALATYEQLASLSAWVPLLDAPAAIVARHARATMLESLHRPEQLQQEAARLAEAVQDPRHRLNRRVYTHYRDAAHLWISGSDDTDDDPVESLRLARSVIASDLAETWRREPMPSSDLVVHTEDVGQQRMLVIERRSAEGAAAFVSPARVLEAVILRTMAADADQIDFSVMDAGQVLVGAAPDAGEREERLPTQAGLPWTLVAVPGADWMPDPDAAYRQRLVVLGVLLVAGAVLAAAWMAGRSMHRELEAARLQSDFVAAVSHEFRTPLAAFGQITELLADGRVADEADRDAYYRRLQHETARLRRLVDDLLDFRRMEAGAHEYHFEPVEVEPLVRDVADECQPDTATPAPRIEFSVSGTSSVVRADREALARSVRNLIDNALKYAAGTPVVRVIVSSGDGDVSIGVRDTGPGIAASDRRAIFDKFVRASDRKAAVRGTGLGLAMVSHIMAAHGGRIDLDSEIGRGSTFTLILPTIGSMASRAGSI